MLARAHYRREVIAWLLIATMMGSVTGGVIGVIVKNAYFGVVEDRWLNFAVAVVTGAQATMLLTSFFWASVSHGRHKIRFLTGLQATAAVLVAILAFVPVTAAGLVMFVIGAVLIQSCWSGIVTLRTAVWRANYARGARAQTAGKIASFQALMMASAAIAVGLMMRRNPNAFHYFYPLAALFGLSGAFVYSRMRMRGHRALLAGERVRPDGHASPAGLAQGIRILRDDQPFRRYMGAMFIFGIGNLSATSLMVIVVRDTFGYEYLGGVILTASIPVLIMPLSIPFWSRMLDRMHIIRFRAFHSWAFVASNLALMIAAFTVCYPLLWLSAVIRGVAIGGGVLGWNLGHHDYTSPAKSSQYMGVHVTLTGIRGLIGPLVAVTLYELFNDWKPGAGAWVFVICLTLNVIGAFLFIMLKRTLDTPQSQDAATEAMPQD